MLNSDYEFYTGLNYELSSKMGFTDY